MKASPEASKAREQLLAGIPVAARRLELAGISTAVLEGGSGPPLVLLHGPREHAGKWFTVLPELVETHRVIAPDLPGHGETDASSVSLDAERVLSWLGALLEATCPTPPTIVGHTLGGAMALRFAIARPDRVRGLVLADPLGLVPFQPAPEFGRVLTEFVTRPDEQSYETLWAQCAHDVDAIRQRTADRWELLRAYSVERARVPELQAQLQTLLEEFGFMAIPTEELGRITVPTSLIWGRHDPATPLQVAETASARYGWPLHVIEDAGADPETERPVAFIAALRAAERELAASPAIN